MGYCIPSRGSWIFHATVLDFQDLYYYIQWLREEGGAVGKGVWKIIENRKKKKQPRYAAYRADIWRGFAVYVRLCHLPPQF